VKIQITNKIKANGAKNMAVEDFSVDANNNTSIGGVGLPLINCPPGNMDNAIRELMAQLAQWRDGAIANIGGDIDPTLAALAALVFSANKGVYATGNDTFSTYDITAFGRTIAGLADAAALRQTIGGVTITGAFINPNGYITFDISGVPLTIQWGERSGVGQQSYNIPFTQACYVLTYTLGGRLMEDDESDEIHWVSFKGASTFSISIAGDYISFPNYYWIAIGR
jgi:hypothetical protein